VGNNGRNRWVRIAEEKTFFASYQDSCLDIDTLHFVRFNSSCRPFRLGILWIFDFQPASGVALVDAVFTLVERFLHMPERLQVIAVAAYEFALAIFDISERSQPMVFQFEDVLGSSNDFATRIKRIGWMRGAHFYFNSDLSNP
jgi:hypothetical protein